MLLFNGGESMGKRGDVMSVNATVVLRECNGLMVDRVVESARDHFRVNKYAELKKTE